ncbi:MAG: Trm112 family protein [bacterium]|nr:Trm112 family protein [bacterium]
MDQQLLEILACPVCKADIIYDEVNQKLICTECKRRYPIRDGIPIMLEEEAEITD